MVTLHNSSSPLGRVLISLWKLGPVVPFGELRERERQWMGVGVSLGCCVLMGMWLLLSESSVIPDLAGCGGKSSALNP